MKKTNRLMALLLAVSLLFAIPATGVYAQEVTTEIEPVTFVSSHYDATAPTTGTNETEVDTSTTYASVEEAGAAMREYMVARENEFTIQIRSTSTDSSSLIFSLYEEAVRHTGNSTEGDALLFEVSSFSCGGTVSTKGNAYVYTLTFTLSYYTTAEQEQELEAKITEVLDDMDLTGKSDYMKILTVYNYLCDNITYDYDNLYDSTYTLKYSAYAALINGTSVCEGYAALFYRMMMELDIDARVVTGENHGWNIVQIGDVYYDIDATWDADAGRNVNTYKYFLKCDANFTGHTRGYEAMNTSSGEIILYDYSSDEFYTAYPMSTTDYSPTSSDYETKTDDVVSGDTSSDTSSSTSSDTSSDTSSSTSSSTSSDTSSSDNTGAFADITVAQSDDEATVTVSGIGTLTEDDLGNVANSESVNLIVVGSGITAIDADTFADFTALTAVVIPDSVTEIDEDAFGTLTDVTIYCYANSHAQAFAEANGYTFTLIGDANYSGTFTAGDALIILQYAVGSLDQSALSATGFYVMDYDGSGAILASDALQVLRLAVS